MNFKSFVCFLAISGGFIFFSCDNVDSTESKAVEDSLKKVHDDSTAFIKKNYDDSLANVKSLDTLKDLGILKLDTTGLTCDSIGKLLLSFGEVDPQLYLYLTAQANECNLKAHNKKNPESAQVLVMYEDPKDNKILFKTISLKTGEDIAAAAKTIITLAVAIKTGDPELTAAAKIIGGYTVDAYLEAAKNNNPLIIIMPTAIPGNQMVKDVYKLSAAAYKEATKLNLDLPVTLQINAVKTVFSFSQAAADFAEKQGIKTVKVGPIKVPVPNLNPLPKNSSPGEIAKKILCPFCYVNYLEINSSQQ